jgi:hypothetical protein
MTHYLEFVFRQPGLSRGFGYGLRFDLLAACLPQIVLDLQAKPDLRIRVEGCRSAMSSSRYSQKTELPGDPA